MDIHEIMQSAGHHIYIGLCAVGDWFKWLWGVLCAWFASLPLPNALKIFSNDTVNLYLFIGVAAYFLIMNIWAFALFGADKASAKRKEMRIRESKLMKICFFGGATGGIIGMNVFRHKTLKKKFSVGVPVMFIIQLILFSFIFGFLGFWTFF